MGTLMLFLTCNRSKTEREHRSQDEIKVVIHVEDADKDNMLIYGKEKLNVKST